MLLKLGKQIQHTVQGFKEKREKIRLLKPINSYLCLFTELLFEKFFPPTL